MRALIADNGAVVPESHIATIYSRDTSSRVYISGTGGGDANDFGADYVDISGSTPIQLAELLGWEIVNKSANGT